MTTLILSILFFIIGLSKGFCDSIEFHDAYSHGTRFWQRDSWKDKKNVFGFVFNAWHTFDITRNALSMVAVLLVIVYPPVLSWWLLLIPVAFQIGFEVAYKYKP